MSLSRLLHGAVTFFIGLILLGNAVATVRGSRDYFSSQMQQLAQDSATSLGISISQPAASKDIATITSFVDAVFDNGFYRSIVYTNTEGDPVISRVLPEGVEGIPSWFINSVAIDDVYGRAEVVSGWYQLGKIHVVPHPSLAYNQLWHQLKLQCLISLIVLVLAYLVLGYVLVWVLRPLKAVARCADAICKGDFYAELPTSRITELRLLTQSIGRMNSHISELLEKEVERANKLQMEVMQDSLTGLVNRKEFIRLVSQSHTTTQENIGGGLLFVKVNRLSQINLYEGRDCGDQLLIDIARRISEFVKKWYPCWVGRCNGSEFGIYFTGLSKTDFEDNSRQLSRNLYELVRQKTAFDESLVVIGGAYNPNLRYLSELFRCANEALLRAASLSSNWHVIDVSEQKMASTSSAVWRTRLERVITEESIGVHYQPIMDLAGSEIMREALARVEQNGDWIDAGAFWTLAERFDLAKKLDKLVIQKVLAGFVYREGCCCSLNISSEFLYDVSCIEWLKKRLCDFGENASQLCFEVNAKTADVNNPVFRSFVSLLSDTNAKLALQNFGSSPTSLAALKQLPLVYVKLGGSFAEAVIDDMGMRFYIQSIIQLVHHCGVKIVATKVDNQQCWQVFKELGVDAGQGYFLSVPQ